jgi:5-methylcytosine-specific restriction protein A
MVIDLHRKRLDWKRDELILALDLYFRVDVRRKKQMLPSLTELSNVLKRLPLYAESEKEENYRSIDAIYMKLCNFLRLDPKYSGKGLRSGAKLDQEIWDRYSGSREELERVADLLRNSYKYKVELSSILSHNTPEAESFFEGTILYKMHWIQDRNSPLIKIKKKQMWESRHKFLCEACDFDYFAYYGERGEGYIECHHNIPISQIKMEHEVKLQDLSLVCSNCHSIIHFRRPWVMVEQLRKEVSQRNKLYSKLF